MSDYSSAPSYGSGPGGVPPNNYLVWAILTTLFCFLPTGVASIVFATQVNTKFAVGDLAGAQEASAKAKKFAIISAIVGPVVAIVFTIIYVVIIAAAVQSGGTS